MTAAMVDKPAIGKSAYRNLLYHLKISQLLCD